MDTAVTDQLLTTTRAVRRRLDLSRPVEIDVVLDCIRLAIQAPTGGNRQGWHWVIVTDPEQRAAFGDIYRAATREPFDKGLALASDTQTRRAYEDGIYLAGVMEQIPVLVIPCLQGRFERLDRASAAGVYGSVIPAVWSFQLALRSRGLGSVYTTAHLTREAEVAELLSIPDDFMQIAMIPLAHTIGTEFKAARRQPVESICSMNRWGIPVELR